MTTLKCTTKTQDKTITLTTISGSIRVGDMVTFANTPKWWQKVLERLRLLKFKESSLYEVTWTSKND